MPLYENEMIETVSIQYVPPFTYASHSADRDMHDIPAGIQRIVATRTACQSSIRTRARYYQCNEYLENRRASEYMLKFTYWPAGRSTLAMDEGLCVPLGRKPRIDRMRERLILD